MIWLPVSFLLIGPPCDQFIPFDVDRETVAGLTYTKGILLTPTRLIDCDYVDSRERPFLIDNGRLILYNPTSDRRRIRYEHHFDLATEVESLKYWLTSTGRGSIVGCVEGRQWTLVAEATLAPSETRTLTWAAEGFLTADFNRDGEVDAIDLSAMLAGWGGEDHDLTGDGIVSPEDIAVLLSQWT